MQVINICYRCGNAVKGTAGKVVFCENCFAGIRLKEEKGKGKIKYVYPRISQ